MKILHLSSERSWRGGEQQMAYLIGESSKQGVQNFVIARKDSAFAEHCKKQNIQLLEVGFKNEVDVFSVFKIKKFCKEHQIDLIHAHSSHSHALAVLSCVFGNRTPTILSRKVDFPIKSNWLSHWKFNHRSIAHIICVSDAIKEILLVDLKDKSHLTTIHDGIDLNRFHGIKGKNLLKKEFGVDANKKIVANISAIAPHKDYFTFVDTAEILLQERDDLHFFIIGDGPLKAEIENYVSSKNLNQHITFTGFRNNVADLFPDIDVFLMTSKTEGLGSTLLDAAANKVPIVSTNAGGIPEFVAHEITGLLANTQDAKQLAFEVSLLIDNTELQTTLCTNALEKLTHYFTKEMMANKTINLYGKIISTKNR
jgi:glycosyltransferase involved in cell wall biosynthesis